MFQILVAYMADDCMPWCFEMFVVTLEGRRKPTSCSHLPITVANCLHGFDISSKNFEDVFAALTLIITWQDCSGKPITLSRLRLPPEVIRFSVYVEPLLCALKLVRYLL